MGMVKVASFPSRVEAGIAAGVLESNGVPHVIVGDDVGIFGPGHQGPFVTGVAVLVPDALLEDAKQLLRDVGLLEPW